ncbi:Flp pilus assembly protein CpaB [Orrella sp. 11846]|uniref:Flp pilus assembly protein CpaB n=1 Tax=Orrella sp. 11846 TaxID=3409913 RepID=UPI003B5BC3B6
MKTPTPKPTGTQAYKRKGFAGFKRWATKLAAPIILAVVTIYAVNQYLTNHSSSETEKEQVLREQLVVNQTLPAATVIDMEHLAIRALPESWFGPDSLSPDDVDQVLGLSLTTELTAGAPLNRSVLKAVDPHAYLEQLGPDRRAVTLPVEQISSSTGLLKPGELIDLYVTFDHKGRRITSLLVSAIEVLKIVSVSGTEQSATGQDVLTLSVSPQQAAKLIAAQHDGVLTAVQMSVQQHKSNVVPEANHLAGYAGIEDSFEQIRMPDIIYADMATGPRQPQP